MNYLFYPFVDAWEANFDSDEFFSFLHALVALMNQVNYFFLHWSRDAQFLIFYEHFAIFNHRQLVAAFLVC